MISVTKKPDTESTGLYFSYLGAFTVMRGGNKKSPRPEGLHNVVNDKSLPGRL